MAEQSQGDLRQFCTDLGLPETIPITANYMVPVTTNYLEPITTNYPSPITTVNYPYYSTVEYINTNPNMSVNLGQIQEEIVFDQNIVNVSGDNLPIDMSVPLDMTVKKDNSFEVGTAGDTGMETNGDRAETVGKETAVPVGEDEEFGEVLQKCPICHKMFMKSDYENFHINTHNTGKEAVVDVSNIPEESVYITKANVQPVSEEILYCTEADFQNVIEENVYVTAANLKNLSQENVYVTKEDFPVVTENNMYSTKADLQNIDQGNVYVTAADLQNTYQENVYVTKADFQNMTENSVHAAQADLEKTNQENLYVTKAGSAVWEGLQERTSNVETGVYPENFNTIQKLITVEYREPSDVSKSAASFSADQTLKNKPDTEKTISPETCSAEYNIPYTTETGVTNYDNIPNNLTANQALSLEAKTNRSLEIPIDFSTNQNMERLQDFEVDRKKASEIGSLRISEFNEASVIGSLRFPESTVGNQTVATLPAGASETCAAPETRTTLPTTVLEFETSQNVITEPIVEHLPDNKVTGLIESYDVSENFNTVPNFEKLQELNKTSSILYQKLCEKLKSDQKMKSVTGNKREQLSETVTTNKILVVNKDTEEILKKKQQKIAMTISTQTEGTSNLPHRYVPVTTENTKTPVESYRETDKEVMDKFEKRDIVQDSTKDNELRIAVELPAAKAVLETPEIEHTSKAKSILDELYTDEIKSILDEMIDQASQREKVKFKSSLDCGIFLCSRCPEMFETDDALKSHLETDHSEEYEAFTIHDLQKDVISSTDIVVIENKQANENETENKVETSTAVVTKSAEDIKYEREPLPYDNKKAFSDKAKLLQTKTLERFEKAKTKTPQTKKIEAVRIVETDGILQGKRKRSINRKFDSDFIVDIDIIDDDEVKRRKKHSLGSESLHKSPVKQKVTDKLKRKSGPETLNKKGANQKMDNKCVAEQQVKVKTNAPFLSRLAIQRKLVVIRNGLQECPICYRRVYGQLGLKSHMDSHKPESDYDTVQEKLKEPMLEKDSAIKKILQTNNKVMEQETVSTTNLKGENEKSVKKDKVPENAVDKSKKAVQQKLASMQEMNKEVHECPTCRMKISSQKGLLMHMKMHKNEKESTPEYENKKVIQEKLVTLGKDLHECPICSRMIAGKYPFRLHMNTHKLEINEEKKETNEKGKIGTTKKTIVKSENERVQSPVTKYDKDNIHTEKKDNELLGTFVKEDSDSEQKKKTVIQEKLATIVGGELHECPICSRLIYGKVRLEAHLKGHSPVKTITEETDIKTSGTEDEIATKEKDNSGDQKEDSKDEIIECSKCSKKIHGQYRLDQHMQTHTKSELLKENLSRLANQRKEVILKRVSMEPLVECPICSKQVHGQYRLDTHMKTQHKDDNEKEISFNFKSEKRRSVVREGDEKSIKTRTKLENDTKELNTTETEMEIENLDGAETGPLVSPSMSNSSRFVKCTVCLKLQRKEYLPLHMQRVHTSDRPFECKICSASFVRKYGLTRHEKTHTKRRDFECNQCDKSFLHKDDLQKHLRRHSGRLEFQCKDCGREFITNAELTKHQKVHSAWAVRDHCCIECGKTFTHYYQLMKHQRLHRKGTVTVAMKHSCTKCGRMFATRSLLESHLPVHNVLTRGRATKHTCRKCGKHFAFRYLLENHMPVHSEKAKDNVSILTRSSTPEHPESERPKATIPKLIKSPGPGVTKSTAPKLNEEKLPPRLTRASTPSLVEVTPPTIVKTKTPESDKNKTVNQSNMSKTNKPEIATSNAETTNIKSKKNSKDKIACEICSLTFKWNSDLIKHKKSHNSEPEVKRSLSTRKTSCKLCGKSFNFKANLMQHLKAHSEVREYSCGRCGKYFSTQDILDKHIASHKSEEFSCAGCKKKFMHAKSLKSHLIRCMKGKRETRSFGRYGKK